MKTKNVAATHSHGAKAPPDFAGEAKEPVQAEINIGMIGHVDHGKTSLVKALTGKWTDTHSEEIKRGISIRLGYADTVFYRCKKCSSPESYSIAPKCPNCGAAAEVSRKVSFVDAPGHETLMTTMLSGATLMQGAVLVVAANEECPQPRTEEHLMALSISGVKNIVVAQNKVDLVDKEHAKKNFVQIKNFLKTYGFENSPIIPIAANFGTNIDLLIEAIESTIKTPPHDLKKSLKMYVVRSFDVNKPGTKPEELQGGILGGSIICGELKVGDTVELSPGINGKKLQIKVVNLSVESKKIPKAVPGGLIAIATLLDPFVTQGDQMRGQMLAKAGTLPEPVKVLRLEIYPFKRLITGSLEGIKVNDMVVLVVGTSVAVGNVVKQVKSNIFEIALKTPVIAETNQRIAISKRDKTSWRLAAYGIAG